MTSSKYTHSSSNFSHEQFLQIFPLRSFLRSFDFEQRIFLAFPHGISVESQKCYCDDGRCRQPFSDQD